MHTVVRCCNRGLISGATRDEHGRWSAPLDAAMAALATRPGPGRGQWWKAITDDERERRREVREELRELVEELGEAHDSGESAGWERLRCISFEMCGWEP